MTIYITKIDAKLYRGEQFADVQRDRSIRNKCAPTIEDADILRAIDSRIYNAACDRHGIWAGWDIAANWNRNRDMAGKPVLNRAEHNLGAATPSPLD